MSLFPKAALHGREHSANLIRVVRCGCERLGICKA